MTREAGRPTYKKDERQAIAKKPDFYRGAGVFKDVKAGAERDMRRQFDSAMMNEMKENPNYMLERDGVEFYLAKDHGFCWGGESASRPSDATRRRLTVRRPAENRKQTASRPVAFAR